jgi:major membrane immunogen (membrane-anchored lipoprotein)
MELMEDPVICEDGYTYERKNIEMLPNSLSPMTKEPIDRTKVIPNRTVKKLIENFIRENRVSEFDVVTGKTKSDSPSTKKSSDFAKRISFTS